MEVLKYNSQFIKKKEEEEEICRLYSAYKNYFKISQITAKAVP